MVGVNVQALAVQVAVPLWVLAPVIEIDTVVLTPAAIVHVPPTLVTVAFVVYGKVRAVLFTDVSVTVGAAVWTVIDLRAAAAGVGGGVGLRRGDGVDAVGGERARERVGPGAGGAGRRCRSRSSGPLDRDRNGRCVAGRGAAGAADGGRR